MFGSDFAYRGQTITYDEIGNPLSYYNGSSYIFTWQNGRQLATAVKGSRTLSFEYNDEGIRTSKTVNGVEHVYYLNGSQILAESWGSVLCVYLYDANGSPIGMQYRTTSYAEGVFDTFWFTKNVQGDIVSVYNNSGTKLLTYHYDAWGSVSTQWHTYTGSDYYASYNPFKYRGYYHDSETGFYYLNSRYYDPATGRFINADSVISGSGTSVQGYNLFAYCFNNPVNMTDSSGGWPQWIEDAANWVDNNVIQPVVNYFDSSTYNLDGSFQEGIFIGSGSLSGGDNEFNWRFNDKFKSSNDQDGWLGAFWKMTVFNATGKIGIGNDNLSVSLKGVGDALAINPQAGLHYSDGLGIGAAAKATVLSGRVTAEIVLFGWEVEFGVCGELLSVGAKATYGIFPSELGGHELKAQANASPGLYGWGYVFRIKSPF